MVEDVEGFERSERIFGYAAINDPLASHLWPEHQERMAAHRERIEAWLTKHPEPVDRTGPGVCEEKGEYRAYLDRGRGEFCLGGFATSEDALAAQRRARESRDLRRSRVVDAVAESLLVAKRQGMRAAKRKALAEPKAIVKQKVLRVGKPKHKTTAQFEPRRDAALALRDAGKTRKEIAAEIGVSPRAVTRYLTAAEASRESA